MDVISACSAGYGQLDLVAGAHIPFPGLGHIRDESSSGFTFVPINYHDRAEP